MPTEHVCEYMSTLVISQGHQSVVILEQDLAEIDVKFHLVGDCLSPRSAEEVRVKRALNLSEASSSCG